jgi:TfoX/Sxy family transcriptional regulator of competence genes
MHAAPGPENLQERLLVRVRKELSGLSKGMTERRMFGGIKFFLNGNMLCGVSRLGLMVRIGADAALFALERPFAAPCPGAGGRLPGFIIVAFAGLKDKRGLASWLDMACRYVGALPAKPVKTPRKTASRAVLSSRPRS